MRTILLFLGCCSILLATPPPFPSMPEQPETPAPAASNGPAASGNANSYWSAQTGTPLRAQLSSSTATAPGVPVSPYSATDAAPQPTAGSAYPNAASAATAMPVVPAVPTKALLSLPSSMDLLDNKTPLQVGESFSYAVLEDLDQPVALYVDTDGNALFPLIGKHKVAGFTPRELAEDLKKELEQNYYFKATVVLARTLAAKGKVFISGQVGSAGSMEIPPTQVWTLSKTILTAGGFTEAADRSRVAIIRHDPSAPKSENRMEYDVGKMMETGDFSADPVVRPGDVILVSRLDMTARVTVSGQVLTPGVYNIPRRDFTVSQAILSAGGLAKYGNAHRVKLIRQVPLDGETAAKTSSNSSSEPVTDTTPKKTVVIIVDLKKVLDEGRRDLDPVVQPNDTINVPERLINF